MSKISKAVKKVDMEGVIRAIVRLGQAAPGPPPGSCPGTEGHPYWPVLLGLQREDRRAQGRESLCPSRFMLSLTGRMT
ncbi:large ribosomal subunit protein uL11m-like isoform X2 [Oncorhynchus clarkii lewisi]|uniref:large ribosomal subunit protein uL11m-like isoform X2 n=1 Tax=Oncorhynchus clarkii lewisi TaxID=490388 RepID=UPI0039B98DD9